MLEIANVVTWSETKRSKTLMVFLALVHQELAKQKMLFTWLFAKCSKPCVGRTVQLLSKRMNGHREWFYQVCNGEDIDDTSDGFSLGSHLCKEHSLNPGDFYKTFDVQILEVCSPSLLEEKDHKYIHTYNTLFPI